MPRVLITAPARQEPKIFELYRESIANLILPDGVILDTYFVVNNCPEIIPLMRVGDTYTTVDNDEEYSKTHNDHLWTRSNMSAMERLRNYTIKYALEHDYDYWFSVDTDLILHPMTLASLLEADKDIISELFFTTSKDVYRWCNAWMCDQYSGHPPAWENTPGIYPCGMTGACTLVKRKVLEAGVNYTRIPNILNALTGEDRYFCVRAAVHGFELWIDNKYPPDHLYTEAEYQKYIAKKQGDNHG